MESESGMVLFDNAKAALMKAVSVDEVKEIRDKAQALKAYSRQSGESVDMQNRWMEIKLRAECRGGQILRDMKLHGGDRK